jgi:hypothetical protein
MKELRWAVLSWSGRPRPSEGGAGAGTLQVPSAIGRGEGVTLGPYQQPGAEKAGGWVWNDRLSAGRGGQEMAGPEAGGSRSGGSWGR